MLAARSLFVTSLGALAWQCAPATERPHEKQRSVISGEVDDATSAVFFVEVTTTLGVSVCTATQITENLLLTAAHCITGQFQAVDCETDVVGSALPIGNFRVTNESDLTGAPDPSWSFPEISDLHLLHQGEPLCGVDLALIELTEPTPLAPSLPVTTSQALTDLNYRAVGYGAVHPSGTGERVRRSSDPHTIECVGTDACQGLEVTGLAGSPAFTAPPVGGNEFIGGPGACPGDSGGPALVDFDGEEAIVGVLSRGTTNCNTNIYSRANTEKLLQTVRELTSGDIPEWAEPPLDPIPPTEGGQGGQGGQAPAEPPDPPPITSEDPSSPREPDGCSCYLPGSRSSNGDYRTLLTLLFALVLLGALRRRHTAQLAP